MTTKIQATDQSVDAAASSMKSSTPYAVVPGVTLNGTNSNSASFAVADKAQGSEVSLPNAEKRVPIGADQKSRIEFK
jgi:hypothetical protein